MGVPQCVIVYISSLTFLSLFPFSLLKDLPGKGDLIAFDAEFVSVQHEDHYLTATGSKMVLREGRSALARMSIIDCRNGRVIIDDHVLPREPVVDYLTRFSGIVEGHLDANSSPHHLITTRNAYLKLRILMERYVFHARLCDASFEPFFLHLPASPSFSISLSLSLSLSLYLSLCCSRYHKWLYLRRSWFASRLCHCEYFCAPIPDC